LQIKNIDITSITKYKPFAIALVKVLVTVYLLNLIYSQAAEYYDADFISNIISRPYSVLILATVFALMLVNWYIESTKWKLLVTKFQALSRVESIRTVLSGVALAIVTPARLGEYGGRLLGITKGHRGKALMANGVGSIAQNVVNISFGLVAILAYISMFLSLNPTTLTALVTITGLILIVLFTLYFRLDLITSFLLKYDQFRLINWLQEQSQFLLAYSSSELMRVLGLATLRYAVFSLQYVLLILLCGITTDPVIASIGVGVIFFLQSGVPLPPMLSVLARGEIAIWVWAVVSVNAMAILTATFLLWAINLVLPALAGAIIIWKSDLSS